MKCHICEKDDIKDMGIFQEPICLECWERNKESFYEQTIMILQKDIKHPKVGCLFPFIKERFDEMCEYIKNDNKARW